MSNDDLAAALYEAHRKATRTGGVQGPLWREASEQARNVWRFVAENAVVHLSGDYTSKFLLLDRAKAASDAIAVKAIAENQEKDERVLEVEKQNDAFMHDNLGLREALTALEAYATGRELEDCPWPFEILNARAALLATGSTGAEYKALVDLFNTMSERERRFACGNDPDCKHQVCVALRKVAEARAARAK